MRTRDKQKLEELNQRLEIEKLALSEIVEELVSSNRVTSPEFRTQRYRVNIAQFKYDTFYKRVVKEDDAEVKWLSEKLEKEYNLAESDKELQALYDNFALLDMSNPDADKIKTMSAELNQARLTNNRLKNALSRHLAKKGISITTPKRIRAKGEKTLEVNYNPDMTMEERKNAAMQAMGIDPVIKEHKGLNTDVSLLFGDITYKPSDEPGIESGEFELIQSDEGA